METYICVSMKFAAYLLFLSEANLEPVLSEHASIQSTEAREHASIQSTQASKARKHVKHLI